ncbi:MULTISPECIES: dihydrolipoyl dehydrogenase [unclassified Leisingera]|uniref:dihydrolipoyl dehydrogenase n=1 Tax=unclassified Leisingera TaxID=2614906 RepID=UPI00057FFF3F|nr:MULTISPECIES: dihydrolipoyl dehydrogenase [unclassified Leisingera]KIC17414.1 dihydrolipoamide dehydrogenase [Leisingera sp. ANG-DT]KIC32288.1 dihydrolipoamide dehydrogenase [Leisingera sp. ANG-S5]
MTDLKCKLLIIGAGPGGYVCAIRAGQLGVDTIVVDEANPGGTCLNVGCIPSKALIHAADEFHKMAHATGGPLGISAGTPEIDLSRTMAWKDGIVKRLTGGVSGLMRKAGVRLVEGRARFIDGKTVAVKRGEETTQIRAERIVIASGSAPVELPALPFGGDILSSTRALSLQAVPETLAVVGAGYIGLELGTAFAKLGTKVTVVEAEDRILPLYDAALTRPVAKRLEALGVKVMTGARAEGYVGGVLATSQGGIEAGKVLVTIGRRPRTEGIGIDELALTLNGPFIRIDKTCQTSMRGIYAIGDVTGEPMLAHRAMAQGEMVAEHAAGYAVEWDKRAIPAVCFTDPEIVTCGALPGEVEGSSSTEFPFAANGRAMTTEREDGFIRVVWRDADRAVLGLQAVGAGVSELSAAFSLAIEMGACLEDIAATIHAHPTQSEGLQEACLRALGHALHI